MTLAAPDSKVYLNELAELKHLAAQIPNTPLMAFAKVIVLTIVNMRYETIMVDRHLTQHPYELVAGILRDAISQLESWQQIKFIEKPSPVIDPPGHQLEPSHHALFQDLWVKFSEAEYEGRIDRYIQRLKINGLGDGWLNGFRCIDFGCGHGNFAHALLRSGAKYVMGIDFGENSIAYATRARDRMGVAESVLRFAVESVYHVSAPDGSFDFAIQNGVFHHLTDEDAAIAEVRRVLKPGGWFWVYTDGEGAISHELWDASVAILKDVPHTVVTSCLDFMNIEAGKKYHLSDGLNAVYRHTSWAELTGQLTRLGFGNFRRLTGGFPTDFDHDVIVADRYGLAKFGEGDLRLLAQKVG